MNIDRMTMRFHEQNEQALHLLAQTGIGRNTYAPPLMRLLWRCGVQLRPPHFMGFGAAALLWGAWFALAWGGMMWMMDWSRHPVDVRLALASACGAGLFFGLTLAAFYAHQRRKHGLPRWESLT
jgi:hypothetical protein